MKAVRLPVEEWPTITAGPLLELVDPESCRVAAVVEGGKVIASLAALRLTHFEGLWIAPEHRNGGVARALIREAHRAASEWPERWALGGAADDRMRDVCERLGGVKVAMDSYVIHLGSE